MTLFTKVQELVESPLARVTGRSGEWRWFALRIAPGREVVSERTLRDEDFHL